MYQCVWTAMQFMGILLINAHQCSTAVNNLGKKRL